MSDSLPHGYTPGVSTQQGVDRPVSRADQPRTPKQLRELIESKRILIKSIQAASDPDYFRRNEQRLLNDIETAQIKLEGLRKNNADGPARIATVEQAIEKLEQELKLTENKTTVTQVTNMLQQLMELGIDISQL
jgi:hypothetical protein